MAKQIRNQAQFVFGIADSNKLGEPGSCRFTRGMDFRSDPAQMTVLPRASLATGTVVRDLPLWHSRISGEDWFYGDSGRIYRIDTNEVTTQQHSAADSQGNGMAFLGEDQTLYYAQNDTIGRYGRIDQDPQFTDDYLSSIGGEPTNTRSLTLVRASSQYASVADTAEQSITGNISLQAYFNPTTLPANLEEQVLVSKWNEASDQRSYKLSINPTAAAFGDGSDGALTISTNTTEAPIDANFSASAAATSFTISNVTGTFSANQKVLLHQTRGTNAGQYEIRTILSVSGTTVTLTEPITGTYAHSATASDANKAQIRVLRQYTDVTINNGITWTAKAWDGLKGGILAFYANGTVTKNGNISANETGFRGGAGQTTGSGQTTLATQGESPSGIGSNSQSQNGGGGGGARGTDAGNAGGGGGGSHATAGETGGTQESGSGFGGNGGSTIYGNSNLTSFNFGSGGGGNNRTNSGSTVSGARGGGSIILFVNEITGSGAITTVGGQAPGVGPADQSGSWNAGGSGAGGSILISTNTSFSVSGLSALGGARSPALIKGGFGGKGGDGRIAVYYVTEPTGTSTPSATLIEDSSLSVSSGHELRFSISSTGANEERYFADISSLIAVSQWRRWSVTWQASTSTANFYAGATHIGSMTRSLTSIYNSTAAFAIGADFDTTAQNFLDGRIDDVRLWNRVLSASEVAFGNNRVLTGSEAGLISYYELEDNYEDSGSAEDDLTASGSPVFTTDIPFSGLTTRKDQDQINDEDGEIYALTTSINEGASHRQTFVPQKDPQTSIMVNISAKGDTADWTLTVHDPQNRVVAEKTVANADLNTGFYEFIFDEVWRPIRGASYHFHLTASNTTGAPAVVTGTTTDLETAYFTSHYQFLVNDKYHPMVQMLNFLAIGNERYVAKLEPGDIYDPHRIVLPSGYRVRCFGFWREFLAIGTWRGQNITDQDSGRIFLWDGISDEINYYVDVPEGSINSMLGSRGDLYFFAGYSGDLMVYRGGDRAEKVKRIPNIGRRESLEVLPGSMSMWRSILQFGIGSSNSETLERGVYSWGSLNERFPQSLNLEHPTSLGVQTDTTIGVVSTGGQNMFIGWQQGNSYGIDRVRPNADPYANLATYQTLIKDNGAVTRRELPLTMRADFEPLEDGQEVSISYKRDRDDSWTLASTASTEGQRFVRSTINTEANEVEFKLDIVCNGNSPVITGFGEEIDDARDTASI